MSGIMALLLLLAVLLVIGSGVLVYSRSHHGALPFSGTKSTPVVYNGSDNNTSPNGIPGGATGAKNGTTPPTSSTSGTVVKIPEASLQISVPDSLKDLTTHVVKNSDGTVVVTFSTRTLATAIPSCAADQNRGAFDLVVRGNGQYPGPAPYSGGIIKQYPTFYTSYQLPVGPCAKNLSHANQVLLDNLTQDFYGTLPSVQPL